MQFEQAIYEYLEDKQNGRKPLRPNTLEGYMSAIKCHLVPQWSGREMESITCDEMQAWVDGFERVGAARKAFNTLRQIYRWYLRAYKVRIWDETQAVALPSAPRRKPGALHRGYGLSCSEQSIGEDQHCYRVSYVVFHRHLTSRCILRDGQLRASA